MDPETTFIGGRWICEGGRGIATLGDVRTACAPRGSAMDVEGEEVLDELRRCVGWKYGSCAERPIRLSTGSPSCTDYLSKAPQKHVNLKEKKNVPAGDAGSALPCKFR